MRKIVYKCFWAWDFEKEENWLNEMAQRGLVLVAIGFCKYTFEKCIPGEYSVRLELLSNAPRHIESKEYIDFIEETGAEYLGSIMRWVYFRRKTDNGEFELYSDYNSRKKHLNRLLLLIGPLALLNMCIGGLNIVMGLATGFNANQHFGIINLMVGTFLAYGFWRVYLRQQELQKQQTLFE